MKNSFFKKRIEKTSQAVSAGFTLVEMLVVVAIFAVLTAVIVYNYGDFNADITVSNMAYEIALTTRQAQIFGLGSRGIGGEFNKAYGIYINNSSGSTKDLIFFSDSEVVNNLCNQGSGTTDCVCIGSDDECIEKLTMQRGIFISKLQVMDGSSCSETDELTILYKRPNPEAQIFNQFGGSPHGGALITVNSTAGRNRFVVIRKNGQISVINENEVATEAPNCSTS